MLARWPRRLAVMVALACAAAVATPVAAAPSDGERIRTARAHYENGVGHYNLDEFAAALTEFTEAYRLKPDASFLFNIAQCHRRLGQTNAAVDYYRKYLRSLPDAPNRAEVERQIRELRAQAEAPSAGDGTLAAPETVTAAPTAPASAPTLLPPAPAPAPASQPGEASIVSVAAPAPAESAPTPLHRRWWFWTAIAVVAAGGIATAVVLSRGEEDPYVGTFGVMRVP